MLDYKEKERTLLDSSIPFLQENDWTYAADLLTVRHLPAGNAFCWWVKGKADWCSRPTGAGDGCAFIEVK